MQMFNLCLRSAIEDTAKRASTLQHQSIHMQQCDKELT